MKRYVVVFEKGETSYGAYVPDLPGCVAAAETLKEAESVIRAAMRFHLDGLREDGLSIPEPTSHVEYVEAWRRRRVSNRSGCWPHV